MDSSSQIKRLQILCPDEKSIEKMLLEATKRPVVFQALEEHITTCATCRATVSRLRKFYSILEQELAQKPSNKVRDFVKSISSGKRSPKK